MLARLPQHDDHCIFPFPGGDGRIVQVRRHRRRILLVLRAPAADPFTTVMVSGVDWDGLALMLARDLGSV